MKKYRIKLGELVGDATFSKNCGFTYFSLYFIPGVGKLFTRRVRFGKTVEATGRTLIKKQGEDLFLEITVHEQM